MPAPAPNLEAILADLRPAAQRLAVTRRRRRRVARTAAWRRRSGGLLATAALGADGAPGPARAGAVKRYAGEVDRGMPARPAAQSRRQSAHSVAVAGDSTVYFAELAGGGYCAELVTRQRPRGAVCSTAAQTDRTRSG